MTKDELKDQIQQQVSKLPYNNILIELATSLGKSRAALLFAENKNALNKCLIVVPKLLMIGNWEREILKWGFNVNNFEFSTYKSISKHYTTNYDTIFWDECHHLSDRAILEAGFMTSRYNVLMSATVDYKKLWQLKNLFPDLYTYTMGSKEAVDEGLLAKPKVIICPLQLDKYWESEVYTFHPKAKNIVYGDSSMFRQYRYDPSVQFRMKCTEQQYYNLLQSHFDWAQKSGKDSIVAQYGGKMLNFCAKCKTRYAKILLSELKNHKTLVFCGSIEQTDELCRNSVNSKKSVKENNYILGQFNEGKIKHLSTVDVLSEGANLSNVSIGVWVKLNRSERLNVQKSGRIYRSNKPVFILMYYMNTRERIAVDDFISNIDQNDIHYCNDITKIKEYL